MGGFAALLLAIVSLSLTVRFGLRLPDLLPVYMVVLILITRSSRHLTIRWAGKHQRAYVRL